MQHAIAQTVSMSRTLSNTVRKTAPQHIYMNHMTIDIQEIPFFRSYYTVYSFLPLELKLFYTHTKKEREKNSLHIATSPNKFTYITNVNRTNKLYMRY